MSDDIGTDNVDLPNGELPKILMQDGVFPYIKEEEAAYILGILKNVDCSTCPCLIKGCAGGYTRQDLALINDRKYMQQQVRGTEGYLCSKLRNIVNLSEAERREVEKTFEDEFKRRVAIIIDNGSTTVVSDSDMDGRVAEIEKNLNEQLNLVQAKSQQELKNVIAQYHNMEQRAKALEEQVIKTRQANENLAQANSKLSEDNELLRTRLQMGGQG